MTAPKKNIVHNVAPAVRLRCKKHARYPRVLILCAITFIFSVVGVASGDDHAPTANRAVGTSTMTASTILAQVEHNDSASHQHAHANRTDDHVATAESGETYFYLLLGIYCLLIVVASLAGGWLPSLINLTHTRIQILISLVGGLMLGIGVFHMFPHAVVELGPNQIDRASWWMMCGLVTMFFLLRTFHFHQHEHHVDQTHDHDHDCGHDHDHDHQTVELQLKTPALPTTDVHHLSWLGVFTGLAIHTLIDGMALGASMHSEAHHAGANWLLGLGTFLAILLHKPLDAVSITSLMAAAHWPRSARTLVNAMFSLMCPLGAILFVIGVERTSMAESQIVGCALAFSAGVFLCIALSDLLPEMEFHSHNRLQLSASLLLGLAVAYGIRYLEPSHVHDHGGASHPASVNEHHH